MAFYILLWIILMEYPCIAAIFINGYVLIWQILQIFLLCVGVYISESLTDYLCYKG